MSLDSASDSRIELRAASLSVGVGLVLSLLKFAAYFITKSDIVFSDALESIVNVAASGVALYSVRLSHAPADADHPYGHGKIEFISAGFEGGLIVAAAMIIAFKAVTTLIFRHLGIEQIGLGLVVVAAAMVVNGAVGLWMVRLGRRNSSLALEADGRHLMSDAVTSVAALAALWLVRMTGWTLLDPLAALGIAVYIGWTGLGLLRRSAAGLMDEQDADDARTLEAILQSHVGPVGREPRICSFHKLRHRHTGRYHWVDFHISFPPAMSIRAGHDAASAIEGEIERTLGEGDATAHIEPCVEPNCGLCRTSE